MKIYFGRWILFGFIVLLCCYCTKECDIAPSECSDRIFTYDWSSEITIQEYINDSIETTELISAQISFSKDHTGKSTEIFSDNFQWYFDCLKQELIMFRENPNRNADNSFYWSFKVNFDRETIMMTDTSKPSRFHRNPKITHIVTLMILKRK